MSDISGFKNDLYLSRREFMLEVKDAAIIALVSGLNGCVKKRKIVDVEETKPQSTVTPSLPATPAPTPASTVKPAETPKPIEPPRYKVTPYYVKLITYKDKCYEYRETTGSLSISFKEECKEATRRHEKGELTLEDLERMGYITITTKKIGEFHTDVNIDSEGWIYPPDKMGIFDPYNALDVSLAIMVYTNSLDVEKYYEFLHEEVKKRVSFKEVEEIFEINYEWSSGGKYKQHEKYKIDKINIGTNKGIEYTVLNTEFCENENYSERRCREPGTVGSSNVPQCVRYSRCKSGKTILLKTSNGWKFIIE